MLQTLQFISFIIINLDFRLIGYLLLVMMKYYKIRLFYIYGQFIYSKPVINILKFFIYDFFKGSKIFINIKYIGVISKKIKTEFSGRVLNDINE